MRSVHSYLIGILLFITFSTCTRSNDKHFVFQGVLTEERNFIIPQAFVPIDIHIRDNYLILSQTNTPNHMPDIFFQAYSLSDYTYQGSFGRKGRGPGEWILPEIVQSSGSSPYLYLWDVSSQQSTALIHKMTLDSTMQLKEVGLFSVDKGYCYMNRPVISRDSLLVFNEFPPEPAVRVHHLSQDVPVITWKWGTLPLQQLLYDENRGILLANDSCVVYLYRYQDKIDFMDWSLKLKKRLNYQKDRPVIGKDQSDNVLFYGQSFLGEHFLYTLYIGASRNERQLSNYHGPFLEVYDLKGKPIGQYSFSGASPVVFTVDERTFNLYGYRGDDGMEDFISVYHMPELKEYLQKDNP